MTTTPRRLAGALALSSLLSGLAASGACAEDLEKGAQSFRKCRACHDIGPNAANKVGPALNGVFGRTAAAHPGFNYSDAMKTAGARRLVWNDETLNGYLESPGTYLPKNKMAFKGITDEAERADLIAYLKTLKP